MFHLRVLCLSALLSAGWSLAAWSEEGFRRGEWPFTPLRQPDVPETRDDDWVINPVDSFVLAEYSPRPIAEDDARRVRRPWERLRRKLRELSGGKDPDE